MKATQLLHDEGSNWLWKISAGLPIYFDQFMMRPTEWMDGFCLKYRQLFFMTQPAPSLQQESYLPERAVPMCSSRFQAPRKVSQQSKRRP
jgi:hypothetical protein